MQAPSVSLPGELDMRRMRRRAAQAVALIAALALVAWLAPGLGEFRHRLERADAGWLALAVAFEVLSSLSYVVMFRPVFCPQMSRRTSAELALSELGVGALLPAGGLSGLALGAWALRRSGMPADQIARRTVAFFLIKSAANFAAVAVVGTVMALGLLGPSLPLTLTLLPAVLAVATIAATVLLGRRAPGPAGPSDRRLPTVAARAAGALTDGVREAGRLLRHGGPAVVLGSLGYWAWDNAVLWACFHAFGSTPPVGVVLMGYLLGQLGGLLPLPGGVGGVEGGLVAALVAYGAPLVAAAAAVITYRMMQFWVPMLLGAPAFASLQRGLNRPDRPDLCGPAANPAG